MKKNRLYHYLKMLRIHMHSYRLLSITIIISFTILLCLLVSIDSYTFNKFKKVFKAPKEAINISLGTKIEYGENYKNEIKKIIKQNLSENAYTYIMSYSEELTQMHSDNRSVVAEFNFIEDDYLAFFTFEDVAFDKPNCLLGTCDITNVNEILIDNMMYQALSKNDTFEPFMLELPVYEMDGTKNFKKYLVKGVLQFDNEKTKYINIDNRDIIYGKIFFSYLLSPEHNGIITDEKFLILSDEHENLKVLANELGLINVSNITLYNEAYESKSVLVLAKMVIMITLFIVLGLNIYGSFMNVLNKRYFEIGVKRAIGASKRDIASQLLFEITIVLFINLVISIYLCEIFLLMVKLILKYFYSYQVIIYMSVFSFLGYILFFIFLSTIFCALFVYKSTKIEVGEIFKFE